MHSFDEYARFVGEFARYPDDNITMSLVYCALGLTGESGEYAEKIKKAIRDNVFDRELAAKELGDVLWYLTRSAHHLGYSLSEIASMNAKKLADRAERGVLKGSGDER